MNILDNTVQGDYYGTGSRWGVYARGEYPTKPGFANAPIRGLLGFPNISVTSISGSINVLRSSGKAPFLLFASASDISCVGSRINSSWPVYPHTMLEFRWTLRYSDGSPIDWDDPQIDFNGYEFDPYEAFYSPEYYVPIRKDGEYTLTLRCRAPGIEYTTTTTITVTAPTLKHEWYRPAANGGSDAQDGLDPWGFGLTTAAYTESTGVLSQTNAFTSYDHTAATAGNPTDWYNIIYLDKAGIEGWYRIASKTDNSNIVLQDKIGSDQTNVTSSDGPKLTFAGAARTSQATGSLGDADLDRHDTFVHLDGDQGSEVWTFTEGFSFALGQSVGGTGWGDVQKIFGGFNDPNGTQIIAGAAMDTSDNFLHTLMSLNVLGDGNLARWPSCHNLRLDGDNNAWRGIGGVIFDSSTNDDVTFFADRCDIVDCIFKAAEYNESAPTGNQHQYFWWKGSIDNRRNGFYFDTGTATGGSTTTCIDTAKTWTVNEWQDDYTALNLTAGCSGRVDSNIIDTLTGTAWEGGSRSDFQAGDSYAIGYKKAQALLANCEGWAGMVGTTLYTDADNSILDHYLYPAIENNHYLGAYNHFAGSGGVGANHCYNIDFTQTADDVCNYVTIIGNRGGESKWFVEGAGANNNPDGEGTFQNLLIARNAASPVSGFHFHASGERFVNIDNILYGGAGTSTREFHGTFNNTGANIIDRSDTDYVIAYNYIYSTTDSMLEAVEQTTDNSKAELTNNQVYITKATGLVLSLDMDYITNRVYKDNNFYAPNVVGGVVVQDIFGSNLTVVDFNAAIGYDNTTVNPGFADPESGDFLSA